jgi:hypothetical protein
MAISSTPTATSSGTTLRSDADAIHCRGIGEQPRELNNVSGSDQSVELLNRRSNTLRQNTIASAGDGAIGLTSTTLSVGERRFVVAADLGGP